jgi:rRNA processing protein Gar1
MSFSGRVTRASHEGGLLASFEGRVPRLGTSIRITGGKILGRVETVLGAIEEPLIHIHPLQRGIDAKAAVGSPIEIAPRVRSGQGRVRGSRSSSKRRGQHKGRGEARGSRHVSKHHGRGRGGKRVPNKRRGSPKKGGGRRNPKGRGPSRGRR